MRLSKLAERLASTPLTLGDDMLYFSDGKEVHVVPTCLLVSKHLLYIIRGDLGVGGQVPVPLSNALMQANPEDGMVAISPQKKSWKRIATKDLLVRSAVFGRLEQALSTGKEFKVGDILPAEESEVVNLSEEPDFNYLCTMMYTLMSIYHLADSSEVSILVEGYQVTATDTKGLTLTRNIDNAGYAIPFIEMHPRYVKG